MRLTLGFLALCLVSGCSFNPPRPKQCEGEFRPVNAPAEQGTARLDQAQSLALCKKGDGHGLQG